MELAFFGRCSFQPATVGRKADFHLAVTSNVYLIAFTAFGSTAGQDLFGHCYIVSAWQPSRA